MAAPIQVPVDFDYSSGQRTTDRVVRDLEKTFERLGRSGRKNLRPLGEGLSAATASASEFDKSLAAANARVIAFGASAGIVVKVQQAFSALVKSTIDVEKSLKDINVILGASEKQLSKFGTGLFKVAKETGQTFETVAAAATELSRQGLSAEKTLQRTKDAMILARLAGMDAVSAVDALTATLNTFTDAGLNSTKVVNKLAKVDAAFAVSSQDLAQALQRVGASAKGAGVSFDELLAIVTAAQQKTARGGAVIGNSFKTIFTRIQRPEVLNQLEQLGIAVRDLQGNTLPAIRILDGLSRTFDTLSDSQKSIISEQVAGVFQINILKAALSDLNSEYGIYQGALRAASSATNEAVQRNQELNTTVAALLNQTIQSFKELGSTVGAISLAPAMKDLLGGVNTVLGSLTEAAGTQIGQGILSGIGKFIGGPGLAIAGVIGGKLLFNFVKFSKEALSTLMGQNNAAAQQRSLQQNIVALLSQQPNLLAQIQSGQIGANQVARAYLNTLREQQRLQASIGSVAAGAARAVYTGGARVRGGTVKVPGFALATTPSRAGGDGMVPNFASWYNAPKTMNRKMLDQAKRNASFGNKVPFDLTKFLMRSGDISSNEIPYRKFKFFSDSWQKELKREGWKYDEGKRAMVLKQGLPNFAANAIPNFAQSAAQLSAKIKAKLDAGETQGVNQLMTSLKSAGEKPKPKLLAHYQGRVDAIKGAKGKKGEQRDSKTYIAEGLGGRIGVLAGIGESGPKDLTVSLNGLTTRSPKVKNMKDAGYTSVTVPSVQHRAAFQEGHQQQFSDLINNPTMQSAIGSIASDLSYKLFEDEAKDLQPKIRENVKKVKLDAGAEGGVFEAASRMFLGSGKNPFSNLNRQAAFDFEENRAPTKLFRKFFNFGEGLVRADAKRTGKNIASNIVNKTFNDPETAKAYPNFPNFSALSEAVAREKAAGIPSGAIRVGRSSQLVGPSNPQGLAVYNTIDEPRGLSQGINRYKSAGLNPKTAGMPNFASMGQLGFASGNIGKAGGGTLSNVEASAFLSAQRELMRQYVKSNMTQAELNAETKKLAQQHELSKNAESKYVSAMNTLAKRTRERYNRMNSSSGKAGKMGGGQLEIGGMREMMGSMALSMAGGFLPESFSGAIQGASTGLMFGGIKGAVAGGALGSLSSVFDYFDMYAERLKRHSEVVEKNEKALSGLEQAMALKEQGDFAGGIKEFAKATQGMSPEMRALVGNFDTLNSKVFESAKAFQQNQQAVDNINKASRKDFLQTILSPVGGGGPSATQLAYLSEGIKELSPEQQRAIVAEGATKKIKQYAGYNYLTGETYYQDAERKLTPEEEAQKLAKYGPTAQMARKRYLEATPEEQEAIRRETENRLKIDEEVQQKLAKAKSREGYLNDFLKEFQFDATERMEFLRDNVVEVAQTMKSSFKDGFKSFIDGSKSASEAFRSFALTILDKLTDISLSWATNSLFDAFGAGIGKATGSNLNFFESTAPYQTKARGGMVNGGSGVRDDVPAMLMGGEYVIKKSAVDALGVGFLNRVNSYAEGGVVASNQFQKGTLGTRGSFNVGKGLSALAITSDLNPQNALRDQMAQEDEQRVQRYLEYQERKKQAMDAYKQMKQQRRIGAITSAAMAIGADVLGNHLQTKAKAGAETARAAALDAQKGYNFRQAQANRLPIVAPPMNLGSGVSGYPQGYGGIKSENISTPFSRDTRMFQRMLVLGETNKLAPKSIRDLFYKYHTPDKPTVSINRDNDGMVPLESSNKRAQGGSMSTNITPVKPLGTSSAPMPMSFSGGGSGGATAMLAASIQQLSQSIQSGGGAAGGETVVNLTFNIDKSGEAKAEGGDNKKNTGEPSSTDDQKKEKEFGEMIKSVVLETITKQKRPGGLLFKAS
jgi:TP901 family phage tail tape measure protein